MYSISEAPGGFSDDDEHNGFYRVSRIDCGESEQVKSQIRLQGRVQGFVCTVWGKEAKEHVCLGLFIYGEY